MSDVQLALTAALRDVLKQTAEERNQLQARCDELFVEAQNARHEASELRERIEKALEIADGAIIDIQRNMMPTPILDLDAICRVLKGDQ